MKVAVSAIGRFHSFNQARQLEARGSLAALYTGYPRVKMRDSGISPELVHTFPWLQTPYMLLARSTKFQRFGNDALAWNARIFHDRFVAREIGDCDALIALSSMGLLSGRVVQSRGRKYLCDRGSSHIEFQDEILHEEYARHSLVWRGIDSRVKERELLEYEQADAILVPSVFVKESFAAKGIRPEKVLQVKYGSDISRFRPLGEKSANFRVLFVGQLNLRKGLPYLLEAFKAASIKNAELAFVGQVQEHTSLILDRVSGVRPEVLGLLHGDSLVREMSRASVLVLPSIEEGLAMVLAEALACGTPVIASTNTGASDIISDGVEGFVVPIRDVDSISSRLIQLATNPGLLQSMGEAARRRAESWGGWAAYGDRLDVVMRGLMKIDD